MQINGRHRQRVRQGARMMWSDVMRDLALLFLGYFLGFGVMYEKLKKERARCYWKGVEDGYASKTMVPDDGRTISQLNP